MDRLAPGLTGHALSSRRALSSESVGSLLALEALLGTSRILAGIVFPVYDDAFITFRYARNAARGLGFVYEPGEYVLGVTAPAFGVILAPFYLFGLPLPDAAIAINVVADGVILWMAWAGLRRAGSPQVGLVFGVLFSISPMLARASVGGLETGLFLAGLVGATALHHRGYDGWAVCLGTAGCFVRPEMSLLVALFLARALIWQRATLLRLSVVALATAVPPLVLLHGYYGSVVPQSVVAKLQFINSPLGQVLTTLVVPELFAVLCVPFAVVGVLQAARTEGEPRTLTLWCGAYVGAYAVARPLVFSWYSAPVQLTVVLLASYGLYQVASWVRVRWLGDQGEFWLRGCTLVVPILFWTGTLAIAGPSPVTRSVFDPLREYCRDHMTARPTIVATDVGAVGYYCDARILDTMGLVWPDALSFTQWQDVVSAHKPDYVLAYATRDIVRTLREVATFRSYRPVARFSPKGSSDMTLEPSRYPRAAWAQDYILLKRETR
jgi:hypothetical protein